NLYYVIEILKYYLVIQNKNVTFFLKIKVFIPVNGLLNSGLCLVSWHAFTPASFILMHVFIHLILCRFRYRTQVFVPGNFALVNTVQFVECQGA
ncbi:hypothetical protein Q4S25_20210, partial [Morganella morganii]